MIRINANHSFQALTATITKISPLSKRKNNKIKEVAMTTAITASTRRSDYGMTCTQCGNLMIAPEWVEFEDERHVVNLWCCEKCGNQFEFKAFVPAHDESIDEAATEAFFPSLLVA